MVYYLVVTLYVITCLVLILVILLQQGKGSDIANAFGGGASQAAFGARSGATCCRAPPLVAPSSSWSAPSRLAFWASAVQGQW